MSDAGALHEAYRDLVEIDRGQEGVRFSATLLDGTPVLGLAIAPDVGSRITSHERFATEFQHAASVHHAALLPPVAWGTLGDGTLHCAYARLETRELIPGSLSPAMVAGIGVHIGRALAASHDSGLVHGAISTKRILLTEGRGAQLSDFGLFAALSEGGLGPQPAASLLNPAGYSSPEVQLGEVPNSKSDIYSLGASLYELLTGKLPYGGRMTSYVLASVLSDAEGEAEASSGELATPPRPSVKSQSNLIIDALVRAIEQDPEDRWPSAEAFASALAASVSTGEMAAVSSEKRRLGCLPAVAGVLVTTGLVRSLLS